MDAHTKQTDRAKRAAEFQEKTTSIAIQKSLDFLAIGDFWFQYPLDGNLALPPFDFGIVAQSQLQSMGSPPPVILSSAKLGQASTAVLSYENQENFIDAVTKGSWINGKGPDDSYLRWRGRHGGGPVRHLRRLWGCGRT